jgi:hypothetical protein
LADRWRRPGPVLLDLSVVEQRYNAVMEVLRDGQRVVVER